jgi:hypothetical protein
MIRQRPDFVFNMRQRHKNDATREPKGAARALEVPYTGAGRLLGQSMTSRWCARLRTHGVPVPRETYFARASRRARFRRCFH